MLTTLNGVRKNQNITCSYTINYTVNPLHLALSSAREEYFTERNFSENAGLFQAELQDCTCPGTICLLDTFDLNDPSRGISLPKIPV